MTAQLDPREDTAAYLRDAGFDRTVEVTVELTPAQALALAQFVKRSHFGTYRELAVDESEAYLIRDAAARLRESLASRGFGPR